MRLNFFWPCACWVLMGFTGDVAHAEDKAVTRPATSMVKLARSSLKGQIRLGTEYSDNLVVADIDTSSRQQDLAALLDASIDYRTSINEDNQLLLGYQYAHSRQQDQSAFNLHTHYVSGEWIHENKRKAVSEKGAHSPSLTLGVPVRFFYAALDGEHLLSLSQLSPYVSGFVNSRVFLRADYTLSQKDFTNNPQRDNHQHRVGLNTYYFAHGVRRYWVLGTFYEQEDAADSRFDFQAVSLRLNFFQRFTVMGQDWRLKIGYRWDDRDYLSETPQIGENRRDRRHRAQASLRIPFNQQWFGEARWQYQLSDSNLFAADYDQQRLAFYLGWSMR